MNKKFTSMLILLLVFFSTFVRAENSEEIDYNLLSKIILQDYRVIYANVVDFELDGQEELWVVGSKMNKNGLSSTKIYVFKYLDDKYPLIWESEEIRGAMVETETFFINQQRYIWFEISRIDLNLQQMWIFKWNGSNTQRVYPLENEKNEIISEDGFACNDFDDDGEYEIMARLKSQNKTITYVLRNGKMVVKSEDMLKPPMTFSDKSEKPLTEKYPDIANVLGRCYSSYQLMKVEDIDFEKKIYLCKVENKTNEKDKKLIIVETSDLAKKIWYELPNEYVGYLFNGSEGNDLNHDGYQEVIFYDTYLHTEPGVYILSIQPNCFYIVTPTDEDGTTLVFLTGPIDFEDFNKDGYTDIMIDSITEPTYWYWNEQQKQFELK